MRILKIDEFKECLREEDMLEIAQIVLDFTKSNRSGDWDLHLQSSEKMLAWFHA